jgi:hypothetical protein
MKNEQMLTEKGLPQNQNRQRSGLSLKSLADKLKCFSIERFIPHQLSNSQKTELFLKLRIAKSSLRFDLEIATLSVA